MAFSSLVTALLLLLSGCAVSVSGQQCDSTDCRRQELSKLFEEALVNSSEALWKLKLIYFNPSSYHQNPASVSLFIMVTVDDIITITDHCNHSNDIGAFRSSDQWVFEWEYVLQPLSVDGSSSTLAGLVPFLSDTFYEFDPTFSSIMRVLQSSSTNGTYLTMHINTTLHDNPCMDDAISALGMVLVWVSQT